MTTVAAARPWSLRAYAVGMTLATPLLHALLWWRLRRGKESMHSFAQKTMRSPGAAPQAPVLWGHAVGVGEARALAGLFRRLALSLPGVHFLLTTQSVSAQAALGPHALPINSSVQAAPLDTPATVKRFLDHWQPTLALWCELDLWPNVVMATAERGVPMWLLNARLYPQSMRKRRLGAALYRHMLPCFAALYAQNHTTHNGLLSLGAPTERTHIGGNLKALAPPPGADDQALRAWTKALASRPVWLMVSAHDEDLALAAQAHQTLLAQHPDALLVVLPRFVQHARNMVQMLTSQGLRATQKPRVAPIAAALAQVQVLLVDAWGEVGLWGRLTTVAAVGGSWSAVGGHNPYEPLALGCHVLHGPNVHNFAEDYAALATLPTCHPAHDAAALARAVASVWDTTGSRPGASATPFTPEAAQAMLADLQTAAVSATRSAAPHPA